MAIYKCDSSTEVEEDKKADPGAFVPYNNDDDDEDGTLDRLDSDEDTPGEDDLTKVDFLFSVGLCQGVYTEGYVVIRRENTKIKLWWENDKDADEFEFDSAGGLEKVYNLEAGGDCNDCNGFRKFCLEENYLWIEGNTPSSTLKDTGLTVIYRDPCGVDVCVDDVNITVVDVNMDMEGVAEVDEESKGGFIALNDDDDDDNHTADKDESGPITASGSPGSFDEDNLMKITLKKVVPTALTGDVTLKATAGGAKVKVWTGSTKGTEVTLPKTYSTPSDLPKELYVEGYGASGAVRDIVLTLEFTVDGSTIADDVNVTVIDVQTIDVNDNDTITHEIASVLPAAQVPDDHFVTAKGTGDMILNTTITPDTTETRSKISWSGVDSWVLLESKKSRSTSAEYEGTVNVSGKTARRFTNWVVWSTGTSTSHAISESVQATFTSISGGYDVTHTITPADIITQSDRPELSGPKTDDPPDVPAGDTDVANKGKDLSGGADNKWDSSRQVKRRIVNPDGLNFNNFPGNIEFYTTRLNYPSNNACGNDDARTDDPEDNDPYNAPYAGAVFGPDEPSTPSPHAEGNLGDTWEKRLHMRGFSRLNIGGEWYCISDPYLWKVHFKFKKQNESEAFWGLDFNNDGDTSDTVPVWRDDNSSIGLDDSGF